MMAKKNSPSAATLELDKAEKAAKRASFSKCYSTLHPRSCQVASFLSQGKENGVKLQELVRLTGRCEREVRRRIQMERKAGVLILSDNENGYFLPANPDELRRFCRSMRHRAAEISEITVFAEVALADMEGQMMLDGWTGYGR